VTHSVYNEQLHMALIRRLFEGLAVPWTPTRAHNPYAKRRHPKGWRCFFAFIYCCPYLRLNSCTNINNYKIIDCLY